jgi:hypothetical protein
MADRAAWEEGFARVLICGRELNFGVGEAGGERRVTGRRGTGLLTVWKREPNTPEEKAGEEGYSALCL